MASCDFNDVAVQKLCYGLRINTTLQNLNLKDNEIGDSGAEDIAAAFQDGKLRLVHLLLNENQIKDQGAKALAHSIRYLSNYQRTIKELNLNNNLISADGAFYLGEQLRFNPQMININLNLNISIPHSLILQINQQLKYNQTFQEMNFLPQLQKEREHLLRKTAKKNFDIIYKKQQKALKIHKENQSELEVAREMAKKEEEQVLQRTIDLQNTLKQLKQQDKDMEQEIIDQATYVDTFRAESGGKLLNIALRTRVEAEESALVSVHLETDQKELLIRKRENKSANKDLIAAYKRECLRRQQARDEKALIVQQIQLYEKTFAIPEPKPNTKRGNLMSRGLIDADAIVEMQK